MVLCLNKKILNVIEEYIPPNIKKLCLVDYFNGIERDYIEFNSSKIINIKNIYLSQLLIKKSSNFSNLTSLSLYNVYIEELTDEHKLQLSNIKNLKIYASLILNDLTFLKNNEILEFDNINLTQELIISLSNNKKLSKLTIKTNFDNSLLDLSVFKNSKLEYLIIKSYERYILNLNGLERIKYMDLSGLRISNIHHMMYNKILNISDCNIKQHMLPRLLNVEKLDISKNTKINDATIFSSKECKVKILDLSYNYNIMTIDNLINLEELYAIGCNPNISIINNLSKLNNIKLYIKNCYCNKCILEYKLPMQKFIKKQNQTQKQKTINCLYKYKFNWFEI